MKVLRFLGRAFVKITGFIPYLFVISPRCRYENEAAKREWKKNKKGAIIVSNHTSIFDYYLLLYKFCFKVLHTMVADVVYKIKGLRALNAVMENIKIDRSGIVNVNAISRASTYLRKNKLVLIFPEGKLEEKPGKLEDFANSYAFLSITENKKITPIYIEGKYGFFKRAHYMIGEPILPTANANPTEEEVEALNDKVRDKILTLKNKLKQSKKYHTKKFLSRKLWFMDFMKITSVPIFYLIFPTKKYFVGDKKKIKKAFKYNCVLAGNHFGPCDPMFMYMHFFSRRIKIIASEHLYDVKCLRFAFNRSGVIKYRRDTMNQIDVDAFKEALGTLEGNGVVGIFPEGHINFDNSFDENIKGGSATLSLMTNSPIIPFIFANPYKYFSFNRVVIGDPIYPSDYFDYSKPINNDTINNYNKIVYSKMKLLYEESLKRRGKNGNGKNPFKIN